MREAEQGGHSASAPTSADDRREVPCDERKFFESFYRSNVRGTPEDRMTIGAISEMESSYHYNVTENAIIQVMAHLAPPPQGAAVEAWRMLRRRQGLRLLDVGSGTGHWVDFFGRVFHVAEAVAVEITTQMADFLRAKYADQPVRVLEADVAADDFELEAPVDYVSAIGVMFHITDDARWHRAVQNLGAVTRSGGLLFFGGDFAGRTHNSQFHRSDEFASWREFAKGGPVDAEDEVRVNKRVRSLADWTACATAAGLEVVDLVRTPSVRGLTTPENDVLVLRRP